MCRPCAGAASGSASTFDCRTVDETGLSLSLGDVLEIVRVSPAGGREGELEGTRVTLQRRPPDGFEFTIRTPGTRATDARCDTHTLSVRGKRQSAETRNFKKRVFF